MGFLVIEPGFLSTIQDGGRPAFQRFGVPPSGAMDWYAFSAANQLADNAINAPALEFNALGPILLSQQDCLIAVTGHGVRLWVNEKEFPAWMSVFVREGSTIRIEKLDRGAWGYLAVAGGFEVPIIMGSSSTYLRASLGGFEGRTLQADDILPTGTPAADLSTAAGREFAPEYRPSYSQSPTLRIILGPQQDHFSAKGIQTFLTQEYTVQEHSDRMGYRLEGTAIEHLESADIISDGIITGSIQVPASGQPIIMMADHQTTGGYPKIGAVIRADLPLLAQCPPGSVVRFCAVNPQTAITVYRSLINHLLKPKWSSSETFIDHMRA